MQQTTYHWNPRGFRLDWWFPWSFQKFNRSGQGENWRTAHWGLKWFVHFWPSKPEENHEFHVFWREKERTQSHYNFAQTKKRRNFGLLTNWWGSNQVPHSLKRINRICFSTGNLHEGQENYFFTPKFPPMPRFGWFLHIYSKSFMVTAAIFAWLIWVSAQFPWKPGKSITLRGSSYYSFWLHPPPKRPTPPASHHIPFWSNSRRNLARPRESTAPNDWGTFPSFWGLPRCCENSGVGNLIDRVGI